jgi:8-oxo-dGTP pyrophosphatase MutT (NUDIX family)
MTVFENNSKEIVYKQAAALPFRYSDDFLQIMLITSRKNKKWIIPKGLLEEDLTEYELAVKEAYEEAGISGRVSDRSLGVYKYEKWGGICIVRVFPFHVDGILDRWPEDYFRNRKWFNPNEAIGVVDNSELKDIIRNFVEKNKTPSSQIKDR